MLDAPCCGLKILRGKSFPNPESWKNQEWEGNEIHYVELRMARGSSQRRNPGSCLLGSPCGDGRVSYAVGHSRTCTLDLGSLDEYTKLAGHQDSSALIYVALCELGR